MKTIDARGLACPQPVLLTKKALEEGHEVTTLVDNVAATENLRRFASSKGCEVQIRPEKEWFHVELRRLGQAQSASPQGLPAPEVATGRSTGTVLLITSADLGRGSEELGQVLMRAFFHTLGEASDLPAKVIFMNSGVQLTVASSPVLEDLKALEAKGVALFSCGTCLNYFELMPQLAVGGVSNMYEITENLFGAQKVVRL